uniref:Transposase n=1 Tax=Globodera rostochiensis TaxID=31243 RepID=A0A914HLB2_GLORO
MIALNAASQWSKDGCVTISINRAVMEMLATQLLPFNLVDGAGFRKLIEKLQPKYELPHRNHFSQYELPKSFDRAVIAELDVVDNIALTCDGWTSKDNRHSLISVTGHFLDRKLRPKFLVISAKPIKGRHTADAIVAFIREALNDFTIPEDKISSITLSRCAAHVLQLCIKEGLKNIDEEGRKVRKSRTLTDELVELQMKEEIPQTVLIKNVEVRWNSSYKMLERLMKNRSAINLLAIEHLDLPKFNADDWMLLSSIKNVLSPIYEATLLLQSRNTSISAMSFALRKEGDNRFLAIKNVIASAIESRLKQAEEKEILVIATLLDPRFKAVYLDSTRLNQYKDWLICEQEKAQGKNDLCNELLFQKDASGSSAEDIFSQIEKDANLNRFECLFTQPVCTGNETESGSRIK